MNLNIKALRTAISPDPLRVLLLVLLVTVPFLGMTLFNTKGEPREAIVAVSMLEQHNWILPQSCGTDIPYKPPMLAWCIALLSQLLNGGVVSEWTSRLPSALALAVMLTGTCCFVRRRCATDAPGHTAFMTAIVTLTSFEVYRAGMACRVDMLNTMFIVLAIYTLYKYIEHQRSPLPAILMMSGAFLTKGPVGVVLPSLVIWIYVMAGTPRRWWGVTWRIALCGIGASVLPLLWYIAAWRQGGDGFVSLVLEENFGRFTGTMTYESHVNPWWYNAVTLVAGWLPWTLLAVLSLFSIKYRRPRHNGIIRRLHGRFMALDPVMRLSIVTSAVVFIFYCIPSSKRSVYLLPMYPFVGYMLARYIAWLYKARGRMALVYAGVIAVIAIVAPVLMLVITDTTCAIPGVKADIITDMRLYPVQWWQATTLGISAGMGCILLRVISSRRLAHATVMTLLLTTCAIYISFGALYSPAVLNARSDKSLADIISVHAPEGEIYSYSVDPMMRYYTVGFYTGDRVRRLDLDIDRGLEPEHGVMMVPEGDIDAFGQFAGQLADRYTFVPVQTVGRRSCDFRSPTHIFKFIKNDTRPEQLLFTNENSK